MVPQKGLSGRARDHVHIPAMWHYYQYIINAQPSSFEEVVGKQVWKDAMQEEYQSIMKNDVWDVVPRPEGMSVMTSKWICKIKHAADGSIEKY